MALKKQTKDSGGVNGPVHIGSILKAYINAKKIYKSALARTISRSPSAIIQYQKGHTMQAATLIEFSHALKHNFFMDVALLLPEHYSSNFKPDTAKDEEIAKLNQKIALLEAQNEVLKEVAKKE